MSFLKAYLTIHKFDIACFLETLLDSNTTVDDYNLVFYLEQL